jgi:hypothetical protein
MAAADVKRVAFAEPASFTIDMNRTVGSDIENAKFSPLSERGCAELVGAWEWQGFSKWNCGTDHGAVEIDIDKLDDAGTKEVFKQECRAQFFRGHLFVPDFIRELMVFHGLSFDSELQKHVIELVDKSGSDSWVIGPLQEFENSSPRPLIRLFFHFDYECAVSDSGGNKQLVRRACRNVN